MKKLNYYYVSVFILALLVLGSCTGLSWQAPEEAGVFVEKVDGLGKDFIMGADVSTVIALENSGVVFKNRKGEVQDLFKTLKESGINSIRIRIWNDPYTVDGRGFGGGNNDLETAIQIGLRAAAQGLPVLVNFHYSDFWADPSKQQAPRAWKNLDIDKKSEALYRFTHESLERLLDAGVDVHMVQIGNETTGRFCGENNWLRIADLMNAGSRAVREVAASYRKNIKVALHFTNPERAGEYERYVQILKARNVDYDVFASSWYPYWHGSADNFAAVMQRVAELSGKEILCTEISYAYTYEDGDGFANVISMESVVEKPWPVSVQGQTDAVRAAIAAVAAAGKKGLGVYYWEPAWLPVPGASYEERLALWEVHGSGWASSASAEYDPDDAGKYWGGNAWDNQAMFSHDGLPLDSLDVFRLVRSGAASSVRPDSVEEISVRCREGDTLIIPQQVQVVFNDASKKELPVEWEKEAVRSYASAEAGRRIPLTALSTSGAAEYLLHGSVYDEASQLRLPALARIFIVEPNYIDNYSFEEADLSMWQITDIAGNCTELYVRDRKADARTGNKALHFWSKEKIELTVEQTLHNVPPGRYRFSLVLHGGDAAVQDIYIYAHADGKDYRTDTDIDGWRNFRNPSVEAIEVQSGTVTVGASVSCNANAWGSLDDFVLTPLD